MKKKEKIVQKRNRLLRRANIPRWLHHFGPNKFEFRQHALAIWMRIAWKQSWRRIVLLLEGLWVCCASIFCAVQKDAYVQATLHNFSLRLFMRFSTEALTKQLRSI